ncbi:MAG: ABC transporter ATP-binding protein [Bacillota bacterium]
MIEVERLTIRYPGSVDALREISLSVANGESVAIVGANGAGKSTLLHALAGVIPASGGHIRIGGTELTKRTLTEIRSKVGLVFQNPDDQLFMPVLREDIAFGPRNYGVNEEEVQARVDETLKTLHIEHLRDRSPLRMSGGEKRIAAIATVLCMRPEALLFDEPSAFLDPKARRSLIRLLAQLKETKLIATHDLALAVDLCDRVLVLKCGQIAASGRPRELLFDERLMDECGLEAIQLLCDSDGLP